MTLNQHQNKCKNHFGFCAFISFFSPLRLSNVKTLINMHAYTHVRMHDARTPRGWLDYNRILATCHKGKVRYQDMQKCSKHSNSNDASIKIFLHQLKKKHRVFNRYILTTADNGFESFDEPWCSFTLQTHASVVHCIYVLYGIETILSKP